MSLKSFHILFITISSLFTIFFGYWCYSEWSAYDDSKYLFSNGETVNSNFLMVENIEFQDHKSSEINSLVKLNIKKNKYSQDYFYISENCNHI